MGSIVFLPVQSRPSVLTVHLGLCELRLCDELGSCLLLWLVFYSIPHHWSLSVPSVHTVSPVSSPHVIRALHACLCWLSAWCRSPAVLPLSRPLSARGPRVPCRRPPSLSPVSSGGFPSPSPSATARAAPSAAGVTGGLVEAR